MKRCLYMLAFAVCLLGLPSLGYTVYPNPDEDIINYSSTFEEVLQKTSKYKWTVRESQILDQWSENGNIQISPNITIIGKPSKSYEEIYFKPRQSLVMKVVDSETNTYADNFQMQGIVVGTYLDKKNREKAQIFTTSNITFANFITAITNKGGKVTLSNTDFTKNISNTNGGAIYNDSGNLTVNKGSVFTYNLAKNGNGGAIYNGQNGTLVIQKSTIGGQHNEAIYYIMDKIAYSADSNSNSSTSSEQKTDEQLTYTLSKYLGDDSWITDYYLIPEWKDIRGINWAEETSNGDFDSKWLMIYPLGNEAKFGGGLYNDGKTTIVSTTVKYNLASKDGGGIYNTGNLTVKSSDFYRNKAQRGGAIYTKDDTENLSHKTLIQKTEFTMNKAVDGDGQGGAVFVESGNVILKNDVFGIYGTQSSNIAIQGGALYNAGLNTQIISSKFSNNYAEKGGDIYNKGTLSISKSTFGSVPKTIFLHEYIRPIYAIDSNTQITVNNQTQYVRPIPYEPYVWKPVKYNVGSSAFQGGAIYNEGLISEITSSVFNETTALEGGAIYNDSTGNIKNIKSSKFNGAYAKNSDTESDAEALGGAIFNKGTLSVNKSTFIGNYSADKGGAIFNSNGSAEFSSSTFKNNYSKSGGALFVSGGNLTDTKSTFSGNYAENGGAVFVGENGTATFNSSVFILNNAYQTTNGENLLTNGGAIYNKGTLNLNSVTFGNKSKKYKYTNQAKYGSSLYNSGISNLLTSKIIYQDSVLGAIYNTGTLNSQRDSFANNKAVIGGVIYNDSTGILKIEGSNFASNSSSYGGAIYSEGNINIDDKEYTVIKNKKEKKQTAQIKFSKNTVTENGGAIYLANTSTGTIKNAEFGSNKAYKTTTETITTEAIYNIVEGKNVVKEPSTTTTTTTPSGKGGAIYLGNIIRENSEDIVPVEVTESVKIQNTNFISNQSGYGGGAIALESNSALDIESSTFNKNSAYSTVTTKTTINTKKKKTTTTKTPQGFGGAIYANESSVLNIKNTTFTSNTAHKGGALYINSNNVKLVDNTFKSNTVKGDKTNVAQGGAIYLGEGITSSLSGSKTLFEKNNASEGGAIYVAKNGFYNMEDAKFVSNTASTVGGAIYISNYEAPKEETKPSEDNSQTTENPSTDNTETSSENNSDDNTTTDTDTGNSGNENNQDTTSDTTSDEPSSGGESETPTSDEPKTPTPMKLKNLTFEKNKANVAGGIFNASYTDIISSTFKNNSADAGGAIYNSGVMTIDDSTVFEANISNSGGAIYNAGVLTVNKTKFNSNAGGVGGAIYNSYQAKISNSEFINTNKVINNHGGAIINNGGTLEVSSSKFDGNLARYYGGAIYNIAYSLYGSWAITSSGNTYSNNQAYNGGAVYNSGGEFKSTNDTFTKNIASIGGAILNQPASSGSTPKTNLTITGSKFEENSAYYGGAILSSNSISESTSGKIYNATTNIDGATFSKNVAQLYGGAIYFTNNKTTIENSKFDGNHAELYGGALFIGSKEDVLTINSTEFLNNYVSANGGAILNSGNIEFNIKPEEETKPSDETDKDTTSDTDNNQTTNDSEQTSENNTDSTSDTDNGQTTNDSETSSNEESEKQTVDYKTIVFNSNKADNGGAIYNMQYGVIKGDDLKFTNNTVTCNGGAIHNEGYVELSNTSFTENKADSKSVDNKGGAIYNNPLQISTEKSPQGLKLTNTAFGGNSADYGGAVYSVNYLTILGSVFGGEVKETSDEGEKIVVYKGNSAKKSGGALYNRGDANINTTAFCTNTAQQGGAIFNEKNLYIGSYEENDSGNIIIPDYDEDKQYNLYKQNSANTGGAIYNTNLVYINGAKFESNTAEANGGAIFSTGRTIILNTLFESNSSVNGGAIYFDTSSRLLNIVNSKFVNNTAENGGALYAGKNSTVNIIDTNFINNTALKNGGAIFADKDSTVSIQAVNSNIEFSGNKANGNSNSIYLNNATLDLIANDQRKISVNDNIDGKGTINTKGDIYIVNQASIEQGSDITIKPISGTLNVQSENSLLGAKLVLGSSSLLNIANGSIGKLNLKSLVVDNSNVAIDMDLKNGSSDKISANDTNEVNNGGLNVSSVNLVSDSKTPVTIKVGEDSEVTSVSATNAETKEATYKLKSRLGAGGMLETVAYGQKAKPCALAAPVAAQLGGYLTQINSYDQAFMNMDMNMTKTLEERKAEMSARTASLPMENGKWKMENYADEKLAYSPQFSNGINQNGKGLWARPYATFERVNLSGGPKVGSIGYGTFFGGDADLKQLRNGWSRQFSAYIGYNGSTQDYDRQSIDQNGGTIGVTEVWYKNNFFTGLTVNVSGNSAMAQTDLGHENFPMIMAGVASKTGYNWELKNGKFVIQPSILLSYSFVHTFSHKNGIGHRVSSSPLHAIQVAPGIKFIANLPKGWQPYLGINMRWNIMDKTHFSLPDVSIPDMSIRPYVEYGVGLQRKWGERFTGYGQAMLRNGGRNGVMLSVGFKWAIGK